MEEFAKRLSELNQKWHYQLATCGEKIDLALYGIQHNCCVDDDLMIRFSHHDKTLMDFLKKKGNRDKGQRQFCGCIVSKDIGEYNTCPHLCEYCYANASKEAAVRNWKQHENNKFGETINGK